MRISDWSSDACSSDLSLLLEPTDWIRNVTVVEYSKARERALGLYLMRQNFPIAAAFGEPGFAETDAQIADYVAQQRERPYGSFDGGINGGYAQRTSRSVINNTSLSFGALTVRNIFGYRQTFTSPRTYESRERKGACRTG